MPGKGPQGKLPPHPSCEAGQAGKGPAGLGWLDTEGGSRFPPGGAEAGRSSSRRHRSSMSYCWGAGSCGQLGLGEAAAGGPVRCRRGPEAGGGHTLLEAACGERHTLLLRPDGTVCSCGANARGQLGRRLRPGQRPPPRSYTP
ncbi:unnamed protein product, partial [Eretmochelys imbricata]